MTSFVVELIYEYIHEPSKVNKLDLRKTAEVLRVLLSPEQFSRLDVLRTEARDRASEIRRKVIGAYAPERDSRTAQEREKA